ncbi:MAG TPA: MBL fold metallo-hydrolase [Blastocatellia bacterium]|nr:MBL fold metallo-hydrolase [Blastocatellia bacterium]
MRLIVLGSGSSGNAVYIEAGGSAVLVDAGLSGKETARRMTEAGLDPAKLNAILLTHEHEDHSKGAQVLSKTVGARLYTSRATRTECKFQRGGEGIFWGETVSSGEPFNVGSLEFQPFSIPHDGIDTFAITVRANGVKAGVVTDLGYITQLVAEKLRGSDLIVIESNYDREMLRVGPYPWSVKQRIASRLGHLSNDETARWLKEGFDGSARWIVLAHLSRHCNHPELARLNALQALESHGPSFYPDAERSVRVAPHDRPSEWFEL